MKTTAGTATAIVRFADDNDDGGDEDDTDGDDDNDDNFVVENREAFLSGDDGVFSENRYIVTCDQAVLLPFFFNFLSSLCPSLFPEKKNAWSQVKYMLITETKITDYTESPKPYILIVARARYVFLSGKCI